MANNASQPVQAYRYELLPENLHADWKIIVDRVRAAYDKKPEATIQLENARQHGFGFVRALAAAGLVTAAGKADLMELLLYPRSSC
ncbi:MULTISPECIES: hypothetical protein [Comamonas]|uniref:hypothetical protein n=1 Tax=Comamonas TaxID=283 RepID=UPI0001BB111D|nr:hypothetical protein [Comamonas thiooxydans]ACY32187.1 hypothetical protein CtCNB1_1441 [Comamonas thiooxydans]MDO1476581.1 hypothetical protein [Comamonas thiooxydans]